MIPNEEDPDHRKLNLPHQLPPRWCNSVLGTAQAITKIAGMVIGTAPGFRIRGRPRGKVDFPRNLRAALFGLAVCVALAAGVIPTAWVAGSPLAATAPSLGTAAGFAVLGGTTVTNVPAAGTIVNGDLGVWPGLAITGFPPGVVNGTKHAGDAVAQQAQTDVTTAYNALTGQACDVNLSGQDLGGKTLTPGVYCFDSSAQLTGALTLNAQGNANAVWVFKIGSTLTTASNASVSFTNGGQSCNLFWQVGSSATLGTNTAFAGNILALASITLNTNANVNGRTLARNGAVTMDHNTVTASYCAAPTATSTATSTATIAPATATSIAATATAIASLPPATQTAVVATATAVAATATSVAATATAIASLPPATQTAVVATATSVAATATAIASLPPATQTAVVATATSVAATATAIASLPAATRTAIIAATATAMASTPTATSQPGGGGGAAPTSTPIPIVATQVIATATSTPATATPTKVMTPTPVTVVPTPTVTGKGLGVPTPTVLAATGGPLPFGWLIFAGVSMLGIGLGLRRWIR